MQQDEEDTEHFTEAEENELDGELASLKQEIQQASST